MIWVDPDTGTQYKLVEGPLTNRLSYDTDGMVYKDDDYQTQLSCSAAGLIWPDPTPYPTATPKPSPGPTPAPSSLPSASPWPTTLAPSSLPSPSPTANLENFNVTWTPSGDASVFSNKEYVNYDQVT